MGSKIQLGSADVRALLVFAGEIGDCAVDRSDVLSLLDVVQRLVPCLAVSWSRLQFDPAHPNGQVQLNYACTRLEDPSLDEAFDAHYAEHPLCQPARPPMVSISDALTPLQWHRSALYRDCFRPDGIEHELCVELSHPAMQTHVLLLDRGPGLDFDDRDKLVLHLVRAHLDAAFRRFRHISGAHASGARDFAPREGGLRKPPDRRRVVRIAGHRPDTLGERLHPARRAYPHRRGRGRGRPQLASGRRRSPKTRRSSTCPLDPGSARPQQRGGDRP